jgi:hypothetical protein
MTAHEFGVVVRELADVGEVIEDRLVHLRGPAEVSRPDESAVSVA